MEVSHRFRFKYCCPSVMCCVFAQMFARFSPGLCYVLWKMPCKWTDHENTVIQSTNRFRVIVMDQMLHAKSNIICHRHEEFVTPRGHNPNLTFIQKWSISFCNIHSLLMYLVVSHQIIIMFVSFAELVSVNALIRSFSQTFCMLLYIVRTHFTHHEWHIAYKHSMTRSFVILTFRRSQFNARSGLWCKSHRVVLQEC